MPEDFLSKGQKTTGGGPTGFTQIIFLQSQLYLTFHTKTYNKGKKQREFNDWYNNIFNPKFNIIVCNSPIRSLDLPQKDPYMFYGHVLSMNIKIHEILKASRKKSFFSGKGLSTKNNIFLKL